MKIEIIGKNGFEPTEAIRNYAESKLNKVFSMFNEDSISKVRVVTKVYSSFHKVEVTIYSTEQLVRTEVSDPDMYAAIDLSVDKLVSQIRKHREKVRTNIEKQGVKDVFSREFDAESLEKELKAATLVKNKQIELVPMTRDEAITEMELSGHDFFVYLDKETNKTNVLYLRQDGNYANIETT